MKKLLVVILALSMMIGILSAQKAEVQEFGPRRVNLPTVDQTPEHLLRKYEENAVWFQAGEEIPRNEVWFTHNLSLTPQEPTWGDPWIAVHRFTPAQLAEKGVAGMDLTHISFYAKAAATITSAHIRVYTGGSQTGGTAAMPRFTEGTMLVNQAVTGITDNAWNEFELDDPVLIPTDEELWIGYTLLHAPGGSPYALNDHPNGLVGFGDVMGAPNGAFGLPAGTWETSHEFTDLGGYGTYYEQWMIRGRAVPSAPPPGNDLQAVSITGPTAINLNTAYTFEIAVRNRGTNTATGYQVRLMNGATQLAQVNGVSLPSGATHVFDLNWTPNQDGNFAIHGEVVWAADENQNNNTTNPMNVRVFPEGYLELYVGNENSTSRANTHPINFYYNRSISQSIYLDSEINAGGLITDIQWNLNRSSDAIPSNITIQIFMNITEQTSFPSTNSWVQIPEGQAPVYEGFFPTVVAGVQMVPIQLDIPFVYGGGNLLITVVKNDTQYYGSAQTWLNSPTTEARTIHARNDSGSDYNPYFTGTHDLTQTPVLNVPNLVLAFSTSGMGTVTGTALTGGSPFAGVTISLDDTPRTTVTNASGVYTLEYVTPGSYTIRAERLGYTTVTHTITVTANQTTTQNFTIVPNPTVSVTGRIIASDSEEPLPGAIVSLSGYDDFGPVTTASNGTFTIPNVWANQTYVLTVSAVGYVTSTHPAVVGSTTLDMGDVFAYEMAYPPRNVQLSIEDWMTANVTWQPPNIPQPGEQWFTHNGEENMVNTGIGTGDTAMEFLLAHRYTQEQLTTMGVTPGASLSKISFVTTNFPTAPDYPTNLTSVSVRVYTGGGGSPINSGTLAVDQNVPINEVQLLTFGPDDGALPALWNDITLDTPFTIPSTGELWIVVRYHSTGYPGAAPPQPDPNYIANFANLYSLDDAATWATTAGLQNPWARNFLIRAQAINSRGEVITISPISYTIEEQLGLNTYFEPVVRDRNAPEITLRTAQTNNSYTRNTFASSRNTRPFMHYNIYRAISGTETNPANWVTVATNITDTSYADNNWVDLQNGIYRYIVTAVFTNNNQSAPAISNAEVHVPPGTIYIGDPASTVTHQSVPLHHYHRKSISQTIYTQEELKIGGGILTKFIWEFNGAGNLDANLPYKVWVGNTVQESFAGTTAADWVPFDNFVEVFNGTLPTHLPGWQNLEFELETPFNYEGGNLVIMAQRFDSQWRGDNVFRHTAASPGERSMFVYTDGTAGSGDYDPESLPTATGRTGTNPNITLQFILGGLGTLTGTVTSATTPPSPIEGAAVALGGTTRVVYTNADGVYNMPYIQPGTYDITVSRELFTTQTVQVVIEPDETTTQNFSMPQQLSDLAALALTGPINPIGGEESIYEITVRNVSAASIQGSAYNVRLRQVGTNTQLATVAGQTITPATNIVFEIPWSPATDGPMEIYGYVDFPDDLNPENNSTAPMEINIYPEGTAFVYIGNPDSTSYAFEMPFNMYYDTSLVQTIYTADDIEIGGQLIALTYRFRSAGDLAAPRPVSIYMANVPDTFTTFANGTSWLPLDQFVHVYEGTVPVNLPSGFHDITITLDTPFVYEGGNLVVYSHKHIMSYSLGNNQWQYTVMGENRTLYAFRDGTAYNPETPPAGNLSEVIPNIEMIFLTSGLGHLSGTVTTGASVPVANAEIRLAGTNRRTFTNDNGQYNFRYLPMGPQDFVVEAFGFIDQTFSETIIEKDTVTRNIVLQPRPSTTVSGRLVSSMNNQGLVGANVTLTGYADYEVTSGTNGNFTISGVYVGPTYTLRVTADGHTPYENSLVEVPSTTPVNLGDITIFERPNPPMNVRAETNDTNTVATITWEAPGDGVDVTLQYSGETFHPDNALGLDGGGPFQAIPVMRFTQTQLEAFGATGGRLTQISFHINTYTGGSFNLAVFVGGSVNPITPGTRVVTQAVTNVEHVSWNTFTLTNPVDIPSSGEIWIGYEPVNTAGFPMSCDNGPAAVLLGDIMYWGPQSTWLNVAGAGFNANFGIKALVEGAAGPSVVLTNVRETETPVFTPAQSTGVINVHAFRDGNTGERAHTSANFATSGGSATSSRNADFDTPAARTNNGLRSGDNGLSLFSAANNLSRGGRDTRALTHYSVWRAKLTPQETMPAENEWVSINDNMTALTITDPGWATVDSGFYRYVVRAHYTGGQISNPALSNPIGRDTECNVTININAPGGASVAGAVVRLVNNSNPTQNYQATATASGVVVIERVRRGIYTLTVQLQGYALYTNPALDCQGEIASDTVNLEVSAILLFEDFEGAAFPPAGWTMIDNDGDGINWFNSASVGLPGHNSNGSAASASYDNNTGEIDADNFLILPQINLTNSIGANLKWFVAAQDVGYPDTYHVMVSTTTPTVAAFTSIFDEVAPTAANFHERNASLDAYAGQMIWIAFRHLDYDKYILKIDDVEVSHTPDPGDPVYNPVTNLHFELVNGNDVLLTWDAPTGSTFPPTGYKVMRGTTPLAASHAGLTYNDLNVTGGDYTYSVTALYPGGNESTPVTIDVSVNEGPGAIIPLVTQLNGNYPNPFNPVTSISFDIAAETNVRIDIYNIRGQLVRTLVDEPFAPGVHKLDWYGTDDNGRSISSGVYFYQMKTDTYSDIRRMVLMK